MEAICNFINEWRVVIFVPIIAWGLWGITKTLKEIFQGAMDETEL